MSDKERSALTERLSALSTNGRSRRSTTQVVSAASLTAKTPRRRKTTSNVESTDTVSPAAPKRSRQTNAALKPIASVSDEGEDRETTDGVSPNLYVSTVLPSWVPPLDEAVFGAVRDEFDEALGVILAPIAKPNIDVPLEDRIQRLALLQNTGRKFAIKMQSRCDRAVDSLIAGYLGYTTILEASERKAIFAKAASIRKVVESGKGWEKFNDDEAAQEIITSISAVIRVTSLTRRAWDNYRARAERDMRVLARSLPVWKWAEGVEGLGDLGLAVLVAEARNPGNYATKGRLWKRLGLAVIEGERQRKKSDVDEALAHGYNPERHGQVTGCIIDPLFRRQTVVGGPYRAIYDARREHTKVTHADWSDGHSHNDARRVMAKALVKDFWQEWRRRERNPPG